MIPSRRLPFISSNLLFHKKTLMGKRLTAIITLSELLSCSGSSLASPFLGPYNYYVRKLAKKAVKQRLTYYSARADSSGMMNVSGTGITTAYIYLE